MRSEGYSTWFVSVSVRLSVCYHVFCHHVQEIGQRAIVTGPALHWLNLKKAIFLKQLRSKVMASEQANIQSTGLPRPGPRHKKSQRRAYISTPAYYLLL